jgi:hypothetical protein
VHAVQVKDRGADREIQRRSDFGRGGLAAHIEQLEAMIVAALGDLFTDIGNAQQGRLRLFLGHEGADPATRTITPCSASSRSARFTVMRATPNSLTSSCSEGTRAPAASEPSPILRSTWSLTCWYNASGIWAAGAVLRWAGSRTFMMQASVSSRSQ